MKKKPYQILTLVLSIVVFLCYVFSFSYGIYKLLDPDYSSSQATLIVMSSFGGMILAWLPYLAKSIIHIEISFWLDLFIEVFGLLGIFFGEAFCFYYNYPIWDDILHFLSGVWVAFMGYCLIRSLTKKDVLSHPIGMAVIGSILISFSVSFLWEIYEFTFDSLFGTNMQKFMPENDLFNGGDTFSNLFGSDEAIANFYRDPTGYRYALMDTMGDMIEALGGTVLFELVAWPIRNKNPYFFDNQIGFIPRRQEASQGETSSKSI